MTSAALEGVETPARFPRPHPRKLAPWRSVLLHVYFGMAALTGLVNIREDFGGPTLYLYLGCLLGAGALLGFSEFRTLNRANRWTVALMVLMAGWAVMSNLYHRAPFPEFLASLLVQFGVGLSLVRSRHTRLFAAYSALLFALVLYSVMRGLDLNELAAWSRNSLSVYALGSFTLYALAARNQAIDRGERMGTDVFAMALLTFVLSVMAVGRGGIVSSAIVLLFVTFEVRGARVFWGAVAPLALGAVFWGRERLSLLGVELIGYTKFGIDGLYSPRYDLFWGYLELLDPSTVVFGVSEASADPIFAFWGGSHNSYIQFHMQTGVAAALLVVMVLYTIVRLTRCCEWALLGCTLGLAVRAATDTHLVRGNYMQFALLVALFAVAGVTSRRRPRGAAA